MMIISEAQRQLIDAFFQVAAETPKQKITFDRIARKAGMTRENAYRYHFKGTQEIIESIHDLLDNDIRADFEKLVSTDETNLLTFFAENLLPSLYERRNWLTVLYSTDIDPNWLSFLQVTYTPLVKKYLDKIEKKDLISNTLLSQLIVKEFISILSVWMTDTNPEPPALFMKKVMHILHQSPLDMLTQKESSA